MSISACRTRDPSNSTYPGQPAEKWTRPLNASLPRQTRNSAERHGETLRPNFPHPSHISHPPFPVHEPVLTMAPPSSAKKQSSLTSFFTPKTVNGLAAAFQKQQAQSQSPSEPPSSPSLPRRKRPLEEDDDNENEKVPGKTKTDGSKDKPATKRPKPDTATSTAPQAEQDKPATAAVSVKPVAERYGYDPSSSARSHGDDDDEAVRNQELHRKFVKKLGHPDAMARRRGRDASAGAAEDEDAAANEDEDDEEAAAAPAKPSKKKTAGGKSAKLTPMEIQFLDIKRKHMDTVLIMEVGYKFRFLGEDARIAAKELSIVCIPGKMRYDEREYYVCLSLLDELAPANMAFRPL